MLLKGFYNLFIIFLILWNTPVHAVNQCARDLRLDRVAVVGHETTFMMKVLAIAKKEFKQVYFVPMREHVKNNQTMPLIPTGVEVFRGPNKFEELLAKKPEGIVSFQFEYGDKIAALPDCDKPEIIILGSRSGTNQYQALPPATIKALSSIKVVSFWHSRLKQPDSFHGLGRSMLKILSALNIPNNQRILLIGYGQTGKGIAYYLHQKGYPVGVYDKDAAELVVAVHNGFVVASLQDLAKNADVVIDATGGTSPAITPETANYFEQPKVYIISTSTTDHSITIPNGFKNQHGTQFTIDPSHGMANMYYNVGGSDDEAMRTTGFSLLYLLENYPGINAELIPADKDLLKLSPLLEIKIGEAFLKTPQLLGGSPIPKFTK